MLQADLQVSSSITPFPGCAWEKSSWARGASLTRALTAVLCVPPSPRPLQYPRRAWGCGGLRSAQRTKFWENSSLDAGNTPSFYRASVPLAPTLMGTRVSKFPRQCEHLLKSIMSKVYPVRNQNIDIFVFNN